MSDDGLATGVRSTMVGVFSLSQMLNFAGLMEVLEEMSDEERSRAFSYLYEQALSFFDVAIAVRAVVISGTAAVVVGVVVSQSVLFVCRRSERLAAANRRYVAASRKGNATRYATLGAVALAGVVGLPGYPSAAQYLYQCGRLSVNLIPLTPGLLYYGSQHLVGFVGICAALGHRAGRLAAYTFYVNDDVNNDIASIVADTKPAALTSSSSSTTSQK